MKRYLAILTALVLAALPAFAVNPVINGQTIFSDSAPTITTCGTSPTVATGGTSNGATITVGTATTNAYGITVPVLQCKLTFATAFTNAPVVAFSTNSQIQVTVGSLSTTVLIVNFGSNAAGKKFAFIAF